MTAQERLEILTQQYAEELADIKREFEEKFGNDSMARMEYVEKINRDRLTTG